MFKILKEKLVNINKSKLIITWIVFSHVLFILVGCTLLFFPTKTKTNASNHYHIYSSIPPTINETEYVIGTKDARAEKINSVFRKYKCPLEGLGDAFVEEADKNDIPWYLVASIAFQESSCGKNVPTVEGVSSYNAWGYAVYGSNVHTFDNWVEGIEVVSRYLRKRFYSQGITKPSEIMKTYTPPSQGSWYKGVEYFSDMFVNYSD